MKQIRVVVTGVLTVLELTVLELTVLVLTVLALGVMVPCAGPAQAARPSWTWPLAGSPQVSRPFAPGPSPWSPGHRGADLIGTPGTPVRAAGAGVVTFAGLLAGRGVVTVTHGDLRTTYEPVAAAVAPGDRVAAGQSVGTLLTGHPGCPVAACLHWGLKRGETYLDPVRLLRAGPVRLLPLGGPTGGGATTLGPEVAGPEVAGPEVAGPEVAGPEVAGPEVAEREVAGPEVAGPEVAGREVADPVRRDDPVTDRAAGAAVARPAPELSADRTLAVAAVLGGGVLVLGQSARRWRG